jgi:hypothetical protein
MLRTNGAALIGRPKHACELLDNQAQIYSEPLSFDPLEGRSARLCRTPNAGFRRVGTPDRFPVGGRPALQRLALLLLGKDWPMVAGYVCGDQ